MLTGSGMALGLGQMLRSTVCLSALSFLFNSSPIRLSVSGLRFLSDAELAVESAEDGAEAPAGVLDLSVLFIVGIFGCTFSFAAGEVTPGDLGTPGPPDPLGMLPDLLDTAVLLLIGAAPTEGARPTF